MARRKSPTARLWQIWMYSARKDGTFWLAFASPDFERVRAEYLRLRSDYLMAEIRTPLNDVYDSYDPARKPSRDTQEELLWRFDVQAVV